jgi:plastocyanin
MKMKRTYWTFALAALFLVAVMMVGRAKPVVGPAMEAGSPGENAVKIDNFTFSPAALTVPAGTTVRWTNYDDIPHNVVSEDKAFKSKVLDTDENFSYTFAKPGTYSYYCSIHPKMTGKIVVQ